MDPAIPVFQAQGNRSMFVVRQTEEAPAKGLQRDLDSVIFECEFPGFHTPPFREAVKKVKEQVASLHQQLEDDQSSESTAIRSRITFLKDFSPTDNKIFKSVFAAVTSTWGKSSDPAECEKTQHRNKVLIDAITVSIQMSDATIGQKALRTWSLTTMLPSPR